MALHLTFNFDELTQAEAGALTAMLAFKVGKPAGANFRETDAAQGRAILPDCSFSEPQLPQAPAEDEPKRERLPEDQAQKDQAAADAAPRKRRTKAEMEAAKAQAEPSLAQSVDETTAKHQSGNTDEAPTEDELRAGLLKYTAAHDLEKARELLKDFDCKRLTDMPQRPAADQHEFLRLCNG